MSLLFGAFSFIMPAQGLRSRRQCGNRSPVILSLSKYVRSYYRFIVFSLLSIVLCGSVHAQSQGEELKKMRMAYINNKQLSFEVEVYSYASKMDKNASLVSKGYMKKNNDMYYSNYQNYELMINGEKALMIDNQTKEINYYEYKLNKEKTPENFQVNIDSLIQNTDSIIMHPEKDGLKHFTCFSKRGYIKQTEIYADNKSYFVKHILYYYVPSTEDYDIDVDRVEIFYKNIKTESINESFFSSDKYFKNIKSKLIPVGKYQGYKINYSKQNSKL